MAAEPLSLLARSTARPYAVVLGPGASPQALVGGMSSADHPGCLWGQWFGGGVVVLQQPLQVVRPDHTSAALAVLEQQPEVTPSNTFTGLGGGWLACLAYDDQRSWLGFYDHLLRWDSASGWTFESLGLDGREQAMASALADWRTRVGTPDPSAAAEWQVGRFSTVADVVQTRDSYLASVEDAVGRIHRGDFYQVNLCTRLTAEFAGQPTTMFADMAAALEPAYGVLVGTDPTVAGFSPELFLRVEGDQVMTSPIKGTAPRGTAETSSAALRSSAKDAAENVMIVDLMRNDLSRVSRPGSVVVEDLLGLEPHPGVWHLVSTVKAKLEPTVTVSDLLDATFPPGSVTGAPKSSAVAAIAELEPIPRGSYTGVAGFVAPCGRAEFNVVIRSLELTGGRLELGVGGGITADSVPIREWQECLDKAVAVVAAAGSTLDGELRDVAVLPRPDLRSSGVFESVLVVGSRALRLADHLARLDRSCRELYGAGVPEPVADQVRRFLVDAHSAPDLRQALRIVAAPHPGGTLDVSFTVRHRGDPSRTCTVVQRPRPYLSWRHKWVDRSSFQAAEATASPSLPYFAASSRAGPQWAAETSRGNLFVRGLDGIWLTPPLDDDVLPGVTRRCVLDLFDRRDIGYRIAPVPVGLLQRATAALWTSSLSGAVPITAVDGYQIPSDTGAADIPAMINSALGFSQ
ncbi:MAG: Para-aminobenzoate synthase, aminase component [uncultured Propionibacteriaceae bacterium]|uniref:Para-aminobenzoate synthase, aminase component n=1 Tax=uncultured Propionibacteriaceae bacterium TaxID=257457 RepID=A0A6J4NHS9_9ACTN|nr:MAG: Para-aminobenzoate synthase, aminase component [uncultured Propionibacteriaceae bacterium]